MTKRTRTRGTQALCFAVLVIFVHAAAVLAQETVKSARAAAIPDSNISALETKLAQPQTGLSSVRQRLACKKIIREGMELLEAHPAAPNRYRVLGIVFQTQKRLLGLKNSDRVRKAMFDTCEQLSQAPDEYAGLRLEADLLLSEKALAAKEASLQERTDALTAIIKRYRNTSAEAKSLMMAALIAPKLEATALETEVFNALSERFSGDPVVIEFIQKNLGLRRLDVLFSGTFTRDDGATLRFPIDRMGHLCFMVFWSQKTPGVEQYLQQIEEFQAKYPNLFDIFSFNLDELPDAGKSILGKLELDWTIMRLPGGRKSQAFRTYAQKAPLGILINAFGHALLSPMVVRPSKFNLRNDRLSDDRYLAQLQSLFFGDFLVTDPEGSIDPALPPELKMIPMRAGAKDQPRLNRTAKSVPAETLRAIQACFIPPPFRYRLAPAAAMANYTKAEKLCRDTIKRHANAPDLWIVRNRRIVALLGMWNVACEPKHLEQAVREARTSLASKLPPGADVVPRFCLAKEAIRRGDSEPASVLSDFIGKTGEPDVPGSALAAATILALDAHSLDLHNLYRDKLLKAPDDGNPILWPVTTFLRNRYHKYRLLRANYVRHERSSIYGSLRGYVVAHGAPPTRDRLPDLELNTLDGRMLKLPRDTAGKLTFLLFIEPPADKTKTELPREVLSTMKYAIGLRDRHVNKEIEVIAAFLCEDAKRVEDLMKANAWTCRATMVPRGLGNPLVRRLDILSADLMPNVFVLRRDGAVAWRVSGLRYRAEFGYPFAVYLAMRVHAEVCDAEIGYLALTQGDFKKAVRYFATPFVPVGDQRYRWAIPRLHGRALAHMGMKKWDAALADIDAAIEGHLVAFHYGKRGPCDTLAEMRLIRADILDRLGRKEEAQKERTEAAAPTTPHRTSPYGRFHAKLRKFRLSQQ